jgi:predicted dehydrogenase
MAPLQVVLVGAGSMGSLHARVISQSERASLAAVIEPNEETGRAIADRFHSTWRPELDDLSGVDAVVIAAPTEAHHDLAMAVLAAGKPLLVEKPVAGSLTQSEAVVDAAKAAGIPLMCGFVERFNPAILTVQAMIEAPVHVIATRHSPYVPRIRTGVGWDLLVHDVDACIRLIGTELTSVRGGLGYVHPSSEPGAEDMAEVVMGFSNGAIGTASASRIGHRKIRSITVAEIARSIEVDLLRRDVTIYRHVGMDPVPDGLGYRQQTIIEIPELVSSREPLAAQLDHFIDLVEGTVDMDEERHSILPPHRVVARLAEQAPSLLGAASTD